jgi:hypothetical protein
MSTNPKGIDLLEGALSQKKKLMPIFSPDLIKNAIKILLSLLQERFQLLRQK